MNKLKSYDLNSICLSTSNGLTQFVASYDLNRINNVKSFFFLFYYQHQDLR